MIRESIVALAATCLFFVGCSQEQPAVPPASRPEAKPAVQAATPAAPAPATTANPATPPVPAPQPPAKPQEAAKAVEPAPPAPASETANVAPASATSKQITVSESIILTASQGQVTLPHLAHAKLFPCATCHGNGAPGKIGLAKDTAHELCRECHKAKGKGPTSCGGCHKK